jgi:hypothetical protein
VYCNLTINFQLNDLEENTRLERIFEEDNNFSFEREAWLEFLKLKLIVKVGDVWLRLEKKKIGKNFTGTKRFILSCLVGSSF